MQVENLLSEAARQTIANKLRLTAEKLEKGQITPDEFHFDAEWIDDVPGQSGRKRKRPTGRIFLNLSYWTKPLDRLPL